MAKAEIKLEERIIETLQEETVVLSLSIEEAKFIRDLIYSCVGGENRLGKESKLLPRDYADDIEESISRILPLSYYPCSTKFQKTEFDESLPLVFVAPK